jgi:hypothetical protein
MLKKSRMYVDFGNGSSLGIREPTATVTRKDWERNWEIRGKPGSCY